MNYVVWTCLPIIDFNICRLNLNLNSIIYLHNINLHNHSVIMHRVIENKPDLATNPIILISNCGYTFSIYFQILFKSTYIPQYIYFNNSVFPEKLNIIKKKIPG